MVFRYLTSKKGFTFMEIMTVVIILGVLTAFAVPLFTAGLHAQRVKDCKNQQILIESTVNMVMVGMMDTGKSQPEIYFSIINSNPNLDSNHVVTYDGDGVTGNKDDSYVGQDCFILTSEEDKAFTIGDIRGGYRPAQYAEYEEGWPSGYFLKQKKLENVPFYLKLANEQIPQCPFEESHETDYYYYIFSDGTVICNCPDCNE